MLLQRCRQLRSVPCGVGAAARTCRRVVTVRAQAKQDVLLRSLSDLGEIAVLVVDGTNLVAEAVARHKTAPTASAALGRTLLGALLLGSFRKDDEQIQIQFKGDGPVGGILAISDTRGNVKGKVGNPSADPPLRTDGKLDVGAAVGKGVVAVVRSHPLQPNPYTGLVPIVSGEIAEDLANYLVDSEQTNSALGLGVSINRDCSVKSAGGFLIQVLPFCSEETLSLLEANLAGIPSVTQMLNSGMTPQDITDKILNGMSGGPGEAALQPRYGPCDEASLRERMVRAVASLGAEEVRDIYKQEGKIEVTCDFCAQTYQFTDAEILDRIKSAA